MIKLRRAVAFDAAAIQEVHKDSIRNIASSFYPPEIISAWSNHLGTQDTIRKHQMAIDAGTEVVIVAEFEDKIVGFGTMVPQTGELRAVYVSSSAKRQGIATQILSSLENLARGFGLSELHMDASISAEAFYKARGFVELERKKHKLSSGAEMDCVVMKKRLDG
ncbi:MAG: GNAT family N-acetyltransferase [Pseudobdellovibrionaceae bacterium]